MEKVHLPNKFGYAPDTAPVAPAGGWNSETELDETSGMFRVYAVHPETAVRLRVGVVDAGTDAGATVPIPALLHAEEAQAIASRINRLVRALPLQKDGSEGLMSSLRLMEE